MILDVKEVICEFLLSLVDRLTVMRMVFLIYLSPARESRLEDMAHIVVWDLFLIELNETWKLRSRADERNITLEHVPELRQFIDAR